ncbi:MAG: hypothetical protein WBD75_02955 [Phycisphaerae bacterium]
MSLEDWRNIATIVGVIIALVVYITNSVRQHRQRKVENIERYLRAHQRLFRSPFLAHNWKAFEDGTFKRDITNQKLERDFSTLLGEIEYFALLQSTRAISDSMSIYMFGWWAQKLQPLLTPEERNNVYWEQAVHFLDEMKSAADDFYKMTKEERQKYFRRPHFKH